MKKILSNSIRIPHPVVQNDEQYNRTLDLICENQCGITEVALFTADTHAPLTLEELQRRCEIIKGRLAEARARGLRAGINILASIGHHNEDLERSLKGPYTHMTDIDGNICHGSYCMNDERFLSEYIVPAYTALAKAGPEFIWIDDDVRYGHMPIKFSCFCDRCINKVNEENGWSYTREQFKAQLNGGNLALRRAHLRKNSDSIVRLMSLIGKTVRAVNKDIKLGYMTGDRFFEGYEFDRYADALSDGGKYEIMWRPGGGAYTDYSFDDIIEKAADVGRQLAYLPDYVTVRASELENFPCDGLGKTPHSTAQEVLLEVATGCYGSAFNFLPFDGSLDASEPIFKKLAAYYPFEKLLSEKLSDARIVGIHTGWVKSSQIAAPAEKYTDIGSESFSYEFASGSASTEYTTFGAASAFAQYAKEIFDLGLPEAYNLDNASVVMLKETAAAAMSDEEILSILSRGVYMDAEALGYLNSRGFGEYMGFSLGDPVPTDAHEHYLPHELNDGFVGGVRNCRQAFFKGPSYAIIPTAKEARVIADLVDYHGERLADATMGIYENSLGGRICVAGYYPFNKLLFVAKKTQLHRLMNYLSGGKLGVYLLSHARVRVWSYEACGKSFAVIFNMTNNEWENVDFAISFPCKSATAFTAFDLEGKEIKITAKGLGRRIVINKIPPYQMMLVEFEC